MIIWGQRLYGRVLVVAGAFYVATQFFHIWYIPLFPTQSWIIFEGSESTGINSSNWRGHPIPMVFKSVAFGWIRAVALIGGVVCLLMGGTGLASHERDAWMNIAIALGCAGAFIATKRLEKGTPEGIRAAIEKSALPAEAKEQLIAAAGRSKAQLEDLPDPVT
jgi:hypothetical protein